MLRGVPSPLKDSGMTCCLKTFQDKDDKSHCGETETSAETKTESGRHVPSKCQLVPKRFNGRTLFAICLWELNSAASGAHMSRIMHTNTHSCINEEMTAEAHRPSVLHRICSH